MEKTLPLYLGSSVIGSVICCEEEKMLSICARTYATLRGIYRAYVKGTGGELLVGVLAPDGASFSAQKTMSSASLSSMGLCFDSITYAFAVNGDEAIDHIDWQTPEEISPALQENEPIYALARSEGVLFDNIRNPKKMAVPLMENRPFPRADLLCLLKPREISGKLYGVIDL